eukprot:scaffold208779_cov25-Tisochrysis_lutea.AAC.1
MRRAESVSGRIRGDCLPPRYVRTSLAAHQNHFFCGMGSDQATRYLHVCCLDGAGWHQESHVSPGACPFVEGSDRASRA